jgi:putative transposase
MGQPLGPASRRDWTVRVNAPLSVWELRRLRVGIDRGRPYGDDDWIKRTAGELSLGHTMRPEGRPPKRDLTGREAKN